MQGVQWQRQQAAKDVRAIETQTNAEHVAVQEPRRNLFADGAFGVLATGISKRFTLESLSVIQHC